MHVWAGKSWHGCCPGTQSPLPPQVVHAPRSARRPAPPQVAQRDGITPPSIREATKLAGADAGAGAGAGAVVGAGAASSSMIAPASAGTGAGEGAGGVSPGSAAASDASIPLESVLVLAATT